MSDKTEKRYKALCGTRFAVVTGYRQRLIKELRELPGFVQVNFTSGWVKINAQGMTVQLVAANDIGVWEGSQFTGLLTHDQTAPAVGLTKRMLRRCARYGLDDATDFHEANRRTKAAYVYLTMHGFDMKPVYLRGNL